MKKNDENYMVFNILAKEESGRWVGHCLELDIVATSENLDQLKSDLEDLILAQVDYAFSNDNLDNLYRPAPSDVWQEFYKCKAHTEEKIKLESNYKSNNSLDTFVPPWIIAKTCLAGSNCHV